MGICDSKVLGSQLPIVAITKGGQERTRGQHTTHAHEPSGQQQTSSQHPTIAPSDQATYYTTNYYASLLALGVLVEDFGGSPLPVGPQRPAHLDVLDLDVL